MQHAPDIIEAVAGDLSDFNAEVFGGHNPVLIAAIAKLHDAMMTGWGRHRECSPPAQRAAQLIAATPIVGNFKQMFAAHIDNAFADERRAMQQESDQYFDEAGRLRFKNERLTDALMPFAQLGGGCSISDTAAYHDLEDDVVLYSSAGKSITAGDVRAARAAIYATREHGPEASCQPSSSTT